MLRARIFCLWEGRRRRCEGQAADRPQIGCGAARAKSLRAEQHRRNDTREVRGKREDKCFSFSWEKSESSCSLLAGSRCESATVAALGYRHRRENGAGAVAARAGKTQLVEGCGLMAAEPSLSSLYTLDTYVGAQSGRNGWMSVFSSLCIYSIS